MQTKLNLLEHQNNALNHLMKWKVGALFMEAGTGKTRVAMEIVGRSHASELFWFGPLRTLDTIKAEAAKWGGFHVPVTYVGIESIGASDRIYLDTLSRVEASTSAFLVVDESLKIKNIEAKRTKRLLLLSKYAEYRLVLNGTPMSRDLLDLWSQMEFLSPLILGMTLRQFKNTFCKYTTIQKIIGRRRMVEEFITGYENIDYLYSLIRHYIYRCDLQLNVSQNWIDVPFRVSPIERQAYEDVKREFLSMDTLEAKNNNIFLEMTQAMQHSYCLAEAKFEAVDEILETEDEEKTVIFCKYVASREECTKRYKRALVLSYQSSSLGLNLQNRNVTIYFDKTWDYATRVQSGRRTYRTGQEFDCRYYDLTGDIKLEALINKNINKKTSMLEYLKALTKEQLEEEL